MMGVVSTQREVLRLVGMGAVQMGLPLPRRVVVLMSR